MFVLLELLTDHDYLTNFYGEIHRLEHTAIYTIGELYLITATFCTIYSEWCYHNAVHKSTKFYGGI